MYFKKSRGVNLTYRRGRLLHKVAPAYLADLFPNCVVFTLEIKRFPFDDCHVLYLGTNCSGEKYLLNGSMENPLLQSNTKQSNFKEWTPS